MVVALLRHSRGTGPIIILSRRSFIFQGRSQGGALGARAPLNTDIFYHLKLLLDFSIAAHDGQDPYLSLRMLFLK